jgi:hypothetical protein
LLFLPISSSNGNERSFEGETHKHLIRCLRYMEARMSRLGSESDE